MQRNEGETGRGGERETRTHSPIHPFTHSQLRIALVITVAAFALYLRTLAPDVGDADTAEFQFAAWNAGFVHPTGYPLFLILGSAYQHLVPIGNPAFRLNVFNALIAALTIGVMYLVVHKITQQRIAAMLTAASFAVTRTFWYDASAAEVYALNALFLALLVFIALECQDDFTAREFALFCFVFGLALTHHRSVILWLPAFAILFASLANAFRTNHLLNHTWRFSIYFLTPLLLYLYIPLRAPASPYAALTLAPHHNLVLFNNSFDGLINYILGRTFEGELRWDAVSVARLVAFPQILLDQFGALVIALGIVGILALAVRRAWATLAFSLTAFVATMLFASFYHIGDIAHYYIPAFLIWAIWVGVALGDLASRITHHVFRFRFHVSGFIFALVTLAIIVQAILNFPIVDRSDETQHRAQWARLLATPIPSNSILISNDRDEMMPLWYLQYVENTRRDLSGLFPLITPDLTNVARVTDFALDTQRPIFFIKPMAGMEIKYTLRADNTSLVQVLGAANTTPQVATNADLGERVRILGYDLTRAGNTLRVTLYLQPRAALAYNYSTTVRLSDTRGNKLAQGNDHQVGGDFYPSSSWAVGEILRDEHIIELPTDLIPSTCRLTVGMYRLPDFDSLGEIQIDSISVR